MKMKQEKLMILIGGLCIVIAAFAAFIFMSEPRVDYNKAVSYNQILAKEEETVAGTVVTCTVDGARGWFCTETLHEAGKKDTIDYYGMIWLEDNTYIGIKFSEADTEGRESFEEIVKETGYYLDYSSNYLPLPMLYKGVITEMTSEQKLDFDAMLINTVGCDEEYLDSFARYFYIDTTVSDEIDVKLIVVSAVFAVLGILVIVLSITKIMKKNRRGLKGKNNRKESRRNTGKK